MDNIVVIRKMDRYNISLSNFPGENVPYCISLDWKDKQNALITPTDWMPIKKTRRQVCLALCTHMLRMWVGAVLLEWGECPWNRQMSKRQHILLQNVYLSALLVPSEMCKVPVPRALAQPKITSQMPAFELCAGNNMDGAFLKAWRTQHAWFSKAIWNIFRPKDTSPLCASPSQMSSGPREVSSISECCWYMARIPHSGVQILVMILWTGDVCHNGTV